MIIYQMSHNSLNKLLAEKEKLYARICEIDNEIEQIKVQKKLSNKCTNNLVLMFDGGSRGNPGICGAGFVIYKNNKILTKNSRIVSYNNTNNFAEYMGIINGLEYAIAYGYKNLVIKGDSQLIIKQLLGEYKCRNDNLITLYNKARTLLSQLHSYELLHIPRKENKMADSLANLAMDSHQS